MRFAVVVRVVGVASILLAAATARAQGLPTCNVLLVKSPATEAISKTVLQEVKGWVDDSARGSKLVSSLDEADVVLEFNKFGHTMQFDGIPAARRGEAFLRNSGGWAQQAENIEQYVAQP